MIDAEVMAIVERRMAFVEQELSVFPQATPEQFLAAMTAYAEELTKRFLKAPTVVDVPHLYQQGDLLTCTMGNWIGEPTTYVYQWKRAGEDVGAGGNTYVVTSADVGKSLTCVVTATNAAGSSEVTSNAVNVTSPASTQASTAARSSAPPAEPKPKT